MKKLKSFVLILGVFLLCGCSLPYQSDKYPAWKTNGLINSNSESHYQGLNVQDTAHTKNFDITVKQVNEINLTDRLDKINLEVIMEIKNTTSSKKSLYLEDFVLMWDLGNSNNKFTYPISNVDKKDYLVDGLVLNSNESRQIIVSYEIDKDLDGPYAVYYGEVYEDDILGNSYYFYIKK